jgi:hypothetical protein
MARELPRVVRTLGLALIALWALHTLIVTGSLLLDEHYGQLLRGTPEGAPRAPLTDLIQNSTPDLTSNLPAKGSVLVVVDPQELPGFAYFWLTYWLYPRRVDITGDPAATTTTSDDAIVYFQRRDAPSLQAPDRYRLVSDDPGADGGQIVIFVRNGA